MSGNQRRREAAALNRLEVGADVFDAFVSRDRAARVGVGGNCEYNPGWHTALDLRNLLTVSEAIARAALERRESRGAQFREDFQEKSPQLGKINFILRKGPDGSMQLRQDPLPPMPDYLKQVIEEMK